MPNGPKGPNGPQPSQRTQKPKRPSACNVSEAAPGARCKVLLDIVGLKRKSETTRWHFDVAVSQILLESGGGGLEPRCPFSDDDDEPADVESCVQDEESEYVVPEPEPDAARLASSARESEAY